MQSTQKPKEDCNPYWQHGHWFTVTYCHTNEDTNFTYVHGGYNGSKNLPGMHPNQYLMT